MPNLCSLRLSVLLLSFPVIIGCSDTIQIKGKVVKGGQPFLPGNGEVVQVFLSPVTGEEHAADVFPANVGRKNSSFEIPGKKGQGIPRGKYRVAVIHLKGDSDLLQGAFSTEKTPILRDLQSSQELIIDLDNPSG